MKVKNKECIFLSAGSVGGCNRSSLSNDSRQCKEFGEVGGDGAGSRDWLICALRHSSVQFSSILRSALWSPSHDHRSRNQRPRTLLPSALQLMTNLRVIGTTMHPMYFHAHLLCLNAHLSQCLHRFSIVKALEGAFNIGKALRGSFSGHFVKVRK